VEQLIDLLVTVGYIDGLFHQHERDFVRGYMNRLVEHVAVAPGSADAWRTHFDTVYARLDAEVAALAAEVMKAGDESFVQTRLKVRALTLFRSFSPVDQAGALELLQALVQADGIISPPERHLHEEMLALLHKPQPPAATVTTQPSLLKIAEPMPLEPKSLSHPLLDELEHGGVPDAKDYELIFGAITAWERQRARGAGRLLGITDVGQLPIGTRLLDGHVHVQRPDHPVELVVLGDLHGCYACLKAALLQSDFIERARRYQADPANNPDIKLVLLGDYLDRGRFSFEGVLRAALKLLVELPNHVVLLRGNHEFLVRVEGEVKSAVIPAEAVPGIADKVPPDMLEAYRHLFEHMPTSLLFDRTLFVHGGIPRDDTFAANYHDLASLDDYEIRFQMMWSDPAQTDHVPVELQRESPRFSFGKNQFRAFMERIGCHAMIRGHEQIDAGFTTLFDLGDRALHSLFSAGGHDNPDLPAESRYRSVTPMALTVRYEAGDAIAIPWPLRYQPFVTAPNNGLYR
jgi:hypothetical protein